MDMMSKTIETFNAQWGKTLKTDMQTIESVLNERTIVQNHTAEIIGGFLDQKMGLLSQMFKNKHASSISSVEQTPPPRAPA